MKKMPTIFIRNPEKMSELLNEPHPDCGWVFNGEGVGTKKYDGTCCMVRDGTLFKRRELKRGQQPTEDFEPADEIDPNTGKWVGWVPVGDGPEDGWHQEALANALHLLKAPLADGTYELCGPRINGNPENYNGHVFAPHGGEFTAEVIPLEYERLKEWLTDKDIEGIVWHHFDPLDGRMAKIKKKDFGLKR